LNSKTYVLVKCCLKRQGRCVEKQASQNIKTDRLTNIKLSNLLVTELTKQLAH